MKNKGFIATSLVYSFFLVFLALLAVILNWYIFNDSLLTALNEAISNRINREIDSTSKMPSYMVEKLELLNMIPQEEDVSFNNLAISNEGVFISQDNDGASYYYRGYTDDNYVIFGEWNTNSDAPTPMYWRIIRVNGDGSLRIMFYGFVNNNNLETKPISISSWNIDENNQPYYSAFEGNLNNFYLSKIHGTVYESAISDSGFCATFESSISDLENCVKTDEKIICNGEETEISDFSDYDRIVTLADKIQSVMPSFKCKKENMYTVATGNGNGKLTYPIGLISSNEVIMAGGKYAPNSILDTTDYENNIFYLHNNQAYWTMSTFTNNNYTENESALNSAFILTEEGMLIESALNNEQYGVYPVINLKAEYVNTFEGDGTLSRPFIGALNRREQ